VKFLIFSDLHRAVGFFDGGTYEDLRFFEQRAKEEGCEFIIHAGDLCHGPAKKDNVDYIKAYNQLAVPTYHCLGNHDADQSTYEDVMRHYGMENEYYFIDGADARLIVLNPNYYFEDGQYVHYSMSNYYDKSRDHVPPEQLAWLEEVIESSEKPCILLSHESFEREDGVKNREAVLNIIRKANERRKNSVIMCINGHNHKDYMRMMDGVCFWEVNSASFEVLDHRHNHFPQELCDALGGLSATLVMNDPLCAVVTVNEKGIDVKGMTSSFFMNVTKDMTDDPFLDAAGREATAEIRDFHIDL
jgi:predicted phosphodiesterase